MAAGDSIDATIAGLTTTALETARWSGLRGAAIRSIELDEAFMFDDDGGLVVVAVTVDGDPSPVRLTVPAPGAPPWAGLHRLATSGGAMMGGRGGRLVGRPGAVRTVADGPTIGPRVDPSAGDQSHTSVVVDGAAILKLYRRLTPGPNPEAELLAALAGTDAPVPAWVGAVELVSADGSSTAIAIEQAFAPGATDAFETLADGLAAWRAGRAERPDPTLPVATGTALGRLHRALALLGSETATPARRAAWLRTAEDRIDAAIEAVGARDGALAMRIGEAAPAIRRALRPLGDPAIEVAVQRIHGDVHLGQVLPVPSGEVLIIDFEGDPMRSPAERLAPDTPLRDAAGFCRSLDHVARSGLRRAGLDPVVPDPAIDGWLAGARAAFLAAYRERTVAGAYRDGPVDRALLRALELEKELGEFAYAASFLPEWLYAPTGGLRALLGPIVGGVGSAT